MPEKLQRRLSCSCALRFCSPLKSSVALILLTCKAAMGVFDAVAPIELVVAGLPTEHLALLSSALFPVSLLTKHVVEEKELRLRQTMRIMGLREGSFLASWWLTAMVQFAIAATLMSLVCSVFMVQVGATCARHMPTTCWSL